MVSRRVNPYKTGPTFITYDDFKTSPVSQPLCSSKFHEYNNYNKVP